MTTTGWARIRGRADAAVQAYHSANPLRTGLGREELRNRLKLPQATFTHVLQRLADEGVLEETGAVVRAPGHRVTLSDAQEAEAAKYVSALEREPYAPPTELQLDAALLGVLVERGSVVRVADGLVFAAGAYGEMLERILAHLREHGAITVADVRDAFGTSRKYALPLLEHLDQQHITRRQGDQRVPAARPRALVMQERLYGVDFSGAKDAGNKIWIAQAVPNSQGITVQACCPSTELLKCKAERGEVLSALREFIADAGRRGIRVRLSHSACPRT